ncbi:MAG: flippase-like domain-containing protein [Candidatus Schekmanbacteria bacterium]|nr:flippase-like domain-containing protein [Candidatus Schekmanbacteria bacterium]
MTEEQTARRRVPWKLIVRCAGSILLVAFVLRAVPVRAIAARLGSADMALVAAAFALNVTGFFFSVLRWRVLLRGQGTDARIRDLCEIYLVGIFFGSLLPGFLLGSDVVRSEATVKIARSRTRAYLTVAIDRFSGLVVLATFSLCGVALGGAEVTDMRARGIAIAVAFAVLVVGAVLYLPLASSLLRAARQLPIIGGFKLLQSVADGLEVFRAQPRVLAKAMFWAVVLQLNVILYYALIGAAVGISPVRVAYFIVVPLVLILLMLPVSINGIGLRDVLFWHLLAPFGVPRDGAVALAWVDLALYLGIGLIGGAVFLWRGQDLLRLARAGGGECPAAEIAPAGAQADGGRT